uniref:Uncharacterized protein n=1 Tax=Trichogramma kaykai TaxID=54128 RepID=A0ABD2XNB0_9HYME
MSFKHCNVPRGKAYAKTTLQHRMPTSKSAYAMATHQCRALTTESACVAATRQSHRAERVRLHGQVDVQVGSSKLFENKYILN